MILLNRAQVGGVFGPSNYKAGLSACITNKNALYDFHSDSVSKQFVFMGQAIWRIFDMKGRQKTHQASNNNPCVSPDFFEILKYGLLELKLNAFLRDDFSQAARYRITEQALFQKLLKLDSTEVQVFDADGNAGSKISNEKRLLTEEDICGYVMKEDWIVNSYSGVSEKHIIAIAPLLLDKRGNEIKPLFWLYYPEWQNVFKQFAANLYSSGQIQTIDDLFEKRFFNSRISKQSNIFSRALQDYVRGEDLNLESEWIKEKIQNLESDLFPY